MKVLVDAQLPQRLADFLQSKEIDAIHTLQLPKKNATPDHEIIEIADQQSRIVITKDNDFLDNFILKSVPKKLLIVSTGNVSNNDESLIQKAELF